ncbi:MAG: caspase family protein [Deltaproteobacteria bacterium]|nr:caspase family protein [Deltaproteobacteria bacterium]
MLIAGRNHFRSLKLFVLILLLGAIGACSPLRDSDLAAIKTHERYPLKVAVDTSSIEKYRFTPDKKKGGYHIDIYTRNKQKSYHWYNGRLIFACKEFFPLLFDQVEFYDNYIPETEEYDLIVRLWTPDVSDSSRDTRKSVDLKMNMHVDFLNGEKQPIFSADLHSVGKNQLSETQAKRLRVDRTATRDSVRKDRNYSYAMNHAVRGLFRQLGENLTRHPNPLDTYVAYLAGVKKEALEKQTLPAGLTANVLYSDKDSLLPNNTVHAGEESVIRVRVTNQGKGSAFDVKLSTKSNYQNIAFPESVSLGNIPPDGSKDVDLKVKGGLDLVDGTAPFRIVCKEKRGYDSKPYVLNVPAAGLQKPDLSIVRYSINDGNTGFAKGNGNGIPENGETVELIPFVKNRGIGDAVGVNVSIRSASGGIELTRGAVTIPRIEAGKTVTGTLAFSIPRTYEGGDIVLRLQASDARGAAETNKPLNISMETHRPSLAYDYRIIDGNGNGVMENGEQGEIEIIPANKGDMDAMGVSADLACKDLSFSKTHTAIGRISANTTYVPLRFPFKTPRTLEKSSVDVQVKLDQKDFAGLMDRITIPIRLATPDFLISHQVLDSNNDGIIEQGERVDVMVRLENKGKLDADDVVLTLEDKTPDIVETGHKEARIGKLAAGGRSDVKTFTLHVQRRAKVGNVPLHFTITQKDFSKKAITIALNVSAQRPDVIDVARRERAHKVLPARTIVTNTPPLIAIAAPEDGKRVASKSQMLAGTVRDDRGVANIDITLNGRRLDAARGLKVIQYSDDRQNEKRFRIEIPLELGKNVITVTALDMENLSTSESITVFRESARGEIWAAVIGLNAYQSSNIPPLRYAENDARAFAGYLRKNMHLDKDHLFELYDSQATLRIMKSVLGTRLSRMADKPEDTVYIFFAGHGAPEKDAQSKDGDGITKYLLAYDSDPQDLYSTAMPMDEIARILSRIRAERIIFIADSCYSGGAGGRTILTRGGRANLSDAFLDRIARSGKGRIILSSSNANEVSQESDTLRHGFFTYYLLKGLKGEADLDGDRLIDVDEIYRYLNHWVPDQTQGTQHPVKKGQAEGLVIVGRMD